MSEKPESLILETLKRIQSQLAEHSSRFDCLEDLIRKQRHDTAGLLVLAKSVMGDFTEQVAAIEERVAALEAKGAR